MTEAFWGACSGGHQAVAGALLARGADVHWVGWDGERALDASRGVEATELEHWLGHDGAGAASEPAGD